MYDTSLASRAAREKIDSVRPYECFCRRTSHNLTFFYVGVHNWRVFVHLEIECGPVPDLIVNIIETAAGSDQQVKRNAAESRPLTA